MGGLWRGGGGDRVEDVALVLRCRVARAVCSGSQLRMVVLPDLSRVVRSAIGLTYVILLHLSGCASSDGLRGVWLCRGAVLGDIHSVLCKCFEDGLYTCFLCASVQHGQGFVGRTWSHVPDALGGAYLKFARAEHNGKQVLRARSSLKRRSAEGVIRP